MDNRDLTPPKSPDHHQVMNELKVVLEDKESVPASLSAVEYEDLEDKSEDKSLISSASDAIYDFIPVPTCIDISESLASNKLVYLSQDLQSDNVIKMNPEVQESNRNNASSHYYRFNITPRFLEQAEELLLSARKEIKFAQEYYELHKKVEEEANKRVEKYSSFLNYLERESGPSDNILRCLDIAKKTAANDKIRSQIAFQAIEDSRNYLAAMEANVKTAEEAFSTKLSHGSNLKT